MKEEGWYKDPYEAHECRWFSDGAPTALVRDGATESHDEPPAQEPRRPLVPADDGSGGDPNDLRRADDAERGKQRVGRSEMLDRVLDVFTETTPPG